MRHACGRHAASCNRSVASKLWGRGKFTKASTPWQKSTNRPSQPSSLPLSPSLSPNRKARLLRREHDTARLQVTDMSHHLKPCGTIIPLSLWREKGGEGNRRCGARGGGDVAVVGTEREWVSGEVEGVQGWWCWWMLYSWLIQRDSPRDASRSSNKALLFFFFLPFCFFFFFLEYCWVRSSQILWAPVFPHSHLRMPQKLFLADIGPVSVMMFQMNNPLLLRPRRGWVWEWG